MKPSAPQTASAFWLTGSGLEASARRRRRCRSRGRSRCDRRSSGSRRRCGGLGRFQSAIAARGSGGRRPEGITPAQFVGAVLPDQVAVATAPVVGIDRRASSEGGTSHGCNSEHDRYFVQFLHGSPHGGKKPQPGCDKSDASSDHHQKRWIDCATRLCAFLTERQPRASDRASIPAECCDEATP